MSNCCIEFKQLNNIDGSSVVTLNGKTSFESIDNIQCNSGDFTSLQFSNAIGGYAQIANISSQDIRTVTLEAAEVTIDHATVKTIDADTINANTGNITTINSTTINNSETIATRKITAKIAEIITEDVGTLTAGDITAGLIFGGSVRAEILGHGILIPFQGRPVAPGLYSGYGPFKTTGSTFDVTATTSSIITGAINTFTGAELNIGTVGTTDLNIISPIITITGDITNTGLFNNIGNVDIFGSLTVTSVSPAIFDVDVQTISIDAQQSLSLAAFTTFQLTGPLIEVFGGLSVNGDVAITGITGVDILTASGDFTCTGITTVDAVEAGAIRCATIASTAGIPFSLPLGRARADETLTGDGVGGTYWFLHILLAGAGQVTLSGNNSVNSVVVNSDKVKSNSVIVLTPTFSDDFPNTNIGIHSVGNIIPSESFTIRSSNLLDTSTINWIMVKS